MILLDANPLIALVYDQDALNEAAREDLRRLGRNPMILVPPVMAEVCHILPHSGHQNRFRQLIDQLNLQSSPVPDDHHLWTHVFDWLDRYANHEPDWTDGYLAVLTQLDTRFRVWTYDREFWTIWRRPDGSPIPLVDSMPEQR
jgi:predicted nucleic acid-binding protein